MITKLKKALDCKNDSELARKIGVNRSRISYWKTNGFHKSTENLLKLLLDKMDDKRNKTTGGDSA